MKSRWSADKTLEWEPLRPDRVLEVSFDHLQGQRFRSKMDTKRNP